MAYEWRGTHIYYYKKVWKDGTCRSEYGGPAASVITQCAAQLDRLERTQQARSRMDAQDERAKWAALAAPPRELLALEAAARVAVAAALTAAGYHQHDRGQWRKKRVKKDAPAGAGAAPRPAH